MNTFLNEDVKSNKLSKLSVLIANIQFLAGILISVAIICYSIYKLISPNVISGPDLIDVTSNMFYVIYIVIGVICIVVFSLLLKRKNEDKVSVSVLIFAIVFVVYAVETYLELNRTPQKYITSRVKKMCDASDNMGIPLDNRSSEVAIEELKKDGIEVYPVLGGAAFLESGALTTNSGAIYPIGGISNRATLVYHPEAFGRNAVYKSDEHGFNNVLGLYKENNVDIVLTGGCRLEAYGLINPQEENIGALLRKKGFNAINLGKSGNSCVSLQYATIKEYAEPIKPKVVLFVNYYFDMVYVPNYDIHKILSKYLDYDDYDQNLITKQGEIDHALKEFYINSLAENDKENITDILMQTIRLYNLRQMILRSNINQKNFPPQQYHIDHFKEVLDKAQKTTQKWGGKFYLVYQPPIYQFENQKPYQKIHYVKEYYRTVLQVADELNIPVIDMYEEVFAKSPDPLSLFTAGLDPHYNMGINKLMVDVIDKRLKKDGLFR